MSAARKVPAMPYERDPSDWLRKLSPHEWIRAAMGELKQAEQAYARRDVRGAVAGCKRAAGMALNGALLAEPRDGWGRTYVEHLKALLDDGRAPDAVRRASGVILGAQPPGSGTATLVPLRTPSSDDRVLEAARDVVAHAYAVVVKHEA